MVVVSGYFVVRPECKVEDAISKAKEIGVEIHYVKENKVLILIEDDPKTVKRKLNRLKKIEEIENVFIAYYSLE